jgi:hypothetical protein
MLRQEKTRLLISSILIIICLAFVGYRTNQKMSTSDEVCETKGLKEQQELKVKSALPIFESLSRHLLTIQ